MSARIALGSDVARGRTWVRDPADPGVRHREGVPWHARPIPSRLHGCVAHTVVIVRTEGMDGVVHVTGVLHCACGAVASAETRGVWEGRNSRRSAS